MKKNYMYYRSQLAELLAAQEKEQEAKEKAEWILDYKQRRAEPTQLNRLLDIIEKANRGELRGNSFQNELDAIAI